MPKVIKKKAHYGSGSIVEVRPGVWRIRVRTEGRQVCETIKGSEAQAVRLRNEIKREADRGSYVAPSLTLFGDYLNEWLENVAKSKSPGTYMLYRRTSDKHILPRLGYMALQKLRPSTFKEYFSDPEIAGLSASTRQQHYLIINGALDAAVAEGGLIRDNPLKRMSGKPKRDPSESSADAIKHCWTETEARKFLAVAQGYGPRQAALYTLALDTGMRKGELASLKWSDIDWARSVVRVRSTLSYATGPALIGPTKSRKNRALRITEETLGYLQRLSVYQAALRRAAAEVWENGDLVFCRNDGKPLRINNIGDREYAGIIRLANIKRIKFHGMRHTCASLLLAAGVPVNYVSERLGHKDPSITLRIYAHCIPSGEAAMLEKLSAALGFTKEREAPAEGWRN